MVGIFKGKSFPMTPPSSSECDFTNNDKILNPHEQSPKKFTQLKYPQELYKSELKTHNQALAEYEYDIYEIMAELISCAKPNLELYKQQPYLSFQIRQKLVDFLLKISIRLKIIPFVFYKAVRLFDRYCSKRIVLLDQAQLIITTCLWIASKLQGGNNHFVNLNNLDKIGQIKTINDIGYGSGGKYLGPTERYRLPKLHELVKLCGVKCSYDVGMFKQMEVHILNTLEWTLNDPSIEEFIIESFEFNIMSPLSEMFKIKMYLSYVASYSSELIDVHVVDLGQVILDVINDTFKLSREDPNYQTILNSPNALIMDLDKYKKIRKHLIKAIIESSEYILSLFNSRGPQFIYHQIINQYKVQIPPPQLPITPISPASTVSYPNTPPSPFKTTRMVGVVSSPAKNPHTPSSSTTSHNPILKGIPAPHQLPYHFHSPIDQPPIHRYKHYTPKQRSYSSSTSSKRDSNLFETNSNSNSTPASENDSPIWLVKKKPSKPIINVSTQSVGF